MRRRVPAMSALLQFYCCPTSVLLQSYCCPSSVLLQPYFSPTSALLQSYFIPTSVILLSYFIPTSVLLQPYFSPTSALRTSVLLQSYFSPTSALLQSYFIPTSVLLHSYFSPTSALLQSYCSRTSVLLQPYFSPTSVLLQSYFSPTAALLQPYFSPTSVLLQLYFSSTSAVLHSYFSPTVRLRVITQIVHVPTHVLSTHHHAQTTRCFPPVHSPLPHPAQSPSHCSRVFTPSRFQCCTQSHSSTASLPKFSVLSDGHGPRGHLVFGGPVNKCHRKKLPSQATLALVRNGVIQLCSVVPRRASRLISSACVMHVDVCEMDEDCFLFCTATYTNEHTSWRMLSTQTHASTQLGVAVWFIIRGRENVHAQ